MKQLFFALTLLICTRTSAQYGDEPSWNSILSFEAGYTNFRPYKLNDHLRAAGSTTTLTAFQTFGIGTLGTVNVAREGTYDAAYAFHYFYPVTVTADSLRYKFSGWELLTSTYGYDVFHSTSIIDLAFAPGMYWGNIKMRKYFNGGNPKQFELFKNPFIAPMIRAELRFRLGPVAVGGRWSYRYDISKSRWKKGTSEGLPGYRAREMQYIVYLGYVFNRND